MSRNYRAKRFSRKVQQKKRPSIHFASPESCLRVPLLSILFVLRNQPPRAKRQGLRRRAVFRSFFLFIFLYLSFLLSITSFPPFHSCSVSLARSFGAIWRWSGTRCSTSTSRPLFFLPSSTVIALYHVHPSYPPLPKSEIQPLCTLSRFRSRHQRHRHPHPDPRPHPHPHHYHCHRRRRRRRRHFTRKLER